MQHYRFEQVYDADLGQMFLFNNRALIVRSSSKILFFKMAEDKMTGKIKWKLYHTIDQRAFIYFIKGNKRIQVCTDDKIYFYLMDPETYIPALENTMNNFMQCT